MEFVTLNEATAAGKLVIEHIEAQAVKDPAKFNTLAGYVKHYLVNVKEAGLLTPEQWLRDYPNSAEAAYSIIEAEQRRAETEQTATEANDKANALTESLEALRGELAAALERIAELEAAKAPAKSKKQAEPEVEEAEAESED